MPIIFVDVSDEVFFTVKGLSIAFEVNMATVTDQFLRRALGLPNAQIADAIITRLADLKCHDYDRCPKCSCHTAIECRERRCDKNTCPG